MGNLKKPCASVWNLWLKCQGTKIFSYQTWSKGLRPLKLTRYERRFNNRAVSISHSLPEEIRLRKSISIFENKPFREKLFNTFFICNLETFFVSFTHSPWHYFPIWHWFIDVRNFSQKILLDEWYLHYITLYCIVLHYVVLYYIIFYHSWKWFQPITDQITVMIFHEITTVSWFQTKSRTVWLFSWKSAAKIKFPSACNHCITSKKIKRGESEVTNAFITKFLPKLLKECPKRGKL